MVLQEHAAHESRGNEVGIKGWKAVFIVKEELLKEFD